MTPGATHLEHRRLRVPQEDRAALVSPAWDAIGGLIQSNRGRQREHDYDFQGQPLADVSRDARREVLAAAFQWTSQYRNVARPADASAPILLAGHQPQLFHPGVLLKSFALGVLAARHGAVAVNLLIDSDTVKTTGVRVPGGSIERPQIAEIPMDRQGAVIPYEERRILDRQAFADFGRRAAEHLAPLVPDPLIRTLWPMAVDRMRQTDNLGACLAQSRHQLEGRWGLRTLEIPHSWVSKTRSHGRLVAHLLAHLPRLWAIYNDTVEEYRRVNRIRSRAHPVPSLAVDDDWLEAPLWIWTDDDPRRRRLFAQRRGDRVVLTDRKALEIALPLSPEGDGSRAVEQLSGLGRQGIRIRSRALLTTLWARLALGDLFVHGIGGAKYDQLTDAIIRRFFGLEPPGFVILSATLRLPIVREQTTVDDVRRIQRRLRELTYHPERYINGLGEEAGGRGGDPRALVAAKRHWVRLAQTPDNASARYREIRRINEALQPWVASLRDRWIRERRRVGRAVEAEAVLAWREYAFCLHPEKTLREFLAEALPKTG
ncbi:MAG: hypothetical protein ACYTG0_01660 [Planctomycetota bacterium]|jgi:hypothetical protein